MEALVKHKENNWIWLSQYFNVFKSILQITYSANANNIKQNHLQAIQEIHCLVWEQKVHQLINKIPPSTDV
jgi:hypothetical protein